MAKRAKDAAKDGSAEQVDAPGIGHNGGELSEDQKIARFFAYKKRWEAAKLTLKNLEEEIKTKIGKQGVRDIRTAVKLDTPEGEEALKEKIEAEMRVARWMGLPVGAQEEMFPIDRTPAVDVAYATGKRHGLAGDPCKPDYAPDLPQYQSYMSGFHDGQAVLAKGFKPLPTEGEPDLRPRFLQTEGATA